MKVKIFKGNLFEQLDKYDVFAHGVNCAGAMGAGIAVQFKKNFPEMYALYKYECKEGRIIPGAAWLYKHYEEADIVYNHQGHLKSSEQQKLIYNLAIKSHWRLPATYNAVETATSNMLLSLQDNEGDYPNLNLKKVAMPWIGCGLGGLNKNHIKKILIRCLEQANIEIHIYEL